MSELIALGTGEAAFAVFAVFLAGLVRGFAGFALSALIMACLATIIPPIELIPICTMLELTSGLILLRGGFGEANKPMALYLQSGSLIGVPTGLYLTKTIDPSTSKLVALLLVVSLAMMQLARIRLPLSAAPLPTFATGLLSGFVTGLASIGGMVVALYTLALEMKPRGMRGTMILVVTLGGFFTICWQLLYGMIDALALTRYAAFVVPMIAGVLIGRAFFRPDYERYYRPLCLTLLIGLGLVGLARLAL